MWYFDVAGCFVMCGFLGGLGLLALYLVVLCFVSCVVAVDLIACDFCFILTFLDCLFYFWMLLGLFVLSLFVFGLFADLVCFCCWVDCCVICVLL